MNDRFSFDLSSLHDLVPWNASSGKAALSAFDRVTIFAVSSRLEVFVCADGFASFKLRTRGTDQVPFGVGVVGSNLGRGFSVLWLVTYGSLLRAGSYYGVQNSFAELHHVYR